MGRVFEEIKSWWSDDPFPPRTVSLAVPSPNATFAGGAKDTPEKITTFTGMGGRYTVTWDWILRA